MSSQPVYRLPPQYVYGVLSAILLGKKRSFRDDARFVLTSTHLPIQILERENIPARGPCVLLMNHYARPGYSPLWSALAIAALLPMESRWLMTSAWTSPNKIFDPFKRFFSGLLFKNVCKVYGFIPMPPMPPDPREVAERANAVRSLIILARQQLPIAIGIAPEGRDFPGARLGCPPAGTGRLLEQLSKSISLLVPMGIYEENCRLVIHFSAPISLQLSRKYDSNEEKDRHLSYQVMHSIARLLPQTLRGEYK